MITSKLNLPKFGDQFSDASVPDIKGWVTKVYKRSGTVYVTVHREMQDGGGAVSIKRPRGSSSWDKIREEKMPPIGSDVEIEIRYPTAAPCLEHIDGETIVIDDPEHGRVVARLNLDDEWVVNLD